MLNAVRRFRGSLEQRQRLEEKNRVRAASVRGAHATRADGAAEAAEAAKPSAGAQPSASMRELKGPGRGAATLTDARLAALVSSRDVDALDALGGAPAVLRVAGVDAAAGLGEAAIAASRARHGCNTYPVVPARSFAAFVKDALSDVTVIVLIVAACLSLVAESAFRRASRGKGFEENNYPSP